MQWSLSEFLNFLEIESQAWTFVALSSRDSPALYNSKFLSVYFPIDGAVDICLTSTEQPTFAAICKGDMITVLPGHSHAICNSRASDPETTVSNRLLRGILKLRWPAGFDFSRLPAFIRVHGSRNPLNLYHLATSQQPIGMEPVLARAALFALTCAIRDHPECDDIFRDANHRDPIKRAMQYMEVHPFRDWTVTALARKVGMSRSAFASRFLAEMGKPPIKALTDLRMEMAASLLTQTHLKVTDIAERIGYHSESAFLRRFYAHFKITPSKMRTQYRIGNKDLSSAHSGIANRNVLRDVIAPYTNTAGLDSHIF